VLVVLFLFLDFFTSFFFLSFEFASFHGSCDELLRTTDHDATRSDLATLSDATGTHTVSSVPTARRIHFPHYRPCRCAAAVIAFFRRPAAPPMRCLPTAAS